MIRSVLASTVVVLGLAGASVAFAGPMGRDGGHGPGGMIPAGFGGFGGGAMCENGNAVIAGRLAYAETRLGVTDAQRPAWNKLAEAVRAAEPAIKTACETRDAHRAAKEPIPAPEKLATAQKMLTLAQEQLSRIQPAFAEFYAQLSADQKKLVDSMGEPRHGRAPKDRGWHFFGRGGNNPPPPAPAPQQPN